MGLQVWLPLNGDVNNQGLTEISTVGGPAFSDGGILGKAFSNNSLAILNFSTIPCLSNGHSFTFCFWVKSTSASQTVTFFDCGNTTGTGTRLHFAVNNNVFRFGFRADDLDGPTLSVNQWSHIACVYDGNKKYIYINGVLNTSGNSGQLKIPGTTFSANFNCSTMNMNDFRLYDHCLSPREIKEISKGLVLHYPLSMSGQENLYTGSRDFSGTWVSGANWTTDSEQYNGFVVKKKSSVWGGLAQNIPCSNGDIFTISFYAKVDSGGNILSIHRSSLGNVTTGLTILGGNFTSGTDWVTASQIATSWKKYWATVQITSTDITYLQWRIENSVANKYLYVCGMKLERGSIATPWVPNTTDVLYTSLGFNNNIEYDVSGYNHNGTKYGTLTYSSDTPRYNTSAVFNGTDNCIRFPFNDFCTNGDIFTMNIWWKKTELGTKNYETLIGGPSGFEMDTRSGAAQALSLYMASTRGGALYSPFNMNEWYMITLVNDGTNELYYVNGVLVNTIAKKNMPSGNYYVGAWSNETGQNFKGFMSDFRFYKTALSANDILELYHTPISLSNNGTLLTQGEYVES